jgi:hypothetical protein
MIARSDSRRSRALNRFRRVGRPLGLVAVIVGPAVLAVACGAGGDGTDTNGSGAASSSTTSSATGMGGSGAASGAGGALFGGGGSGPSGPWSDFPTDPVLDPSAPPNAPALFGPAGSGDPSGGPCLMEPEPGALFPRNWLRPRFRVTPGAGQNLFEIRIHTDAEASDLVVYTASTTWTMPKPMWELLASHAADVPITVSVRGASFDGNTLVGEPSLGTTGTITVAPADAKGTIVYWTTTGGSSLKGFAIGDETVGTSLTPDQVAMPTVGGAKVTCVGCHTSTPDGKLVGFTAQGPWGNALASIESGKAGEAPPFLGPGALAALDQFGELGIQTYSKAHWSPGDRVMVTPFGAYADAKLAWVDLEATQPGEGQAYGFLARNGDGRGVGAPTWSHDGQTIVYVSTTAETTGRLDTGEADLYAVPYANRAGGDAKPIPGASDPSLSEYYPAFSPDDALLAFNRVPGADNMYNQASAEVFVLPSSGGTATRLAANDPPACSGRTSPGVTNSWPKWAPEATTVGGKTYYWVIFSSTRSEQQNPQLYVTGVVVENGQVETHAALYLWNQPEDEHNHTPAWDVFKIPPNPPPK